MAVTTAVEVARRSRLRLTQVASTHGHGVREGPRGLATSSSTSESRCSHMAPAWSLESLSMPVAAATLCTLRVLVPVAHVSLTAATIALPTLWWRAITSSGKKLPARSFGILGVSVPTPVTRLRSR